MRLTTIDGLKGFAILLVMVSHASSLLVHQNPHFLFPGLASFLPTGGLGVHLFFMVSAFTLALSVGERRKEGSLWRNFYIRRAIRILPLWWLAVALQGYLSQANLHTTLLNLSFGFGLFRFDSSVELIPYGWSLFVEEVFYLFFPLFLALTKNLKGAVNFFIGAVVINQIWNFTGTKLGVPATNYFIEFHPLHHLYNFAIGLLAFQLYRTKVFRMDFLENSHWTSTLNVGAIGLFLVMLRQIAPFHSIAMFAIFIATLSTKTLIHRTLTSPLFTQWGISCYSLYLWHWFLIEACRKGFRSVSLTGPVEWHLLWFIPAFLLCMTVIGKVSFLLIERPLAKLGRNLLKSRSLRLGIDSPRISIFSSKVP